MLLDDMEGPELPPVHPPTGLPPLVVDDKDSPHLGHFFPETYENHL